MVLYDELAFPLGRIKHRRTRVIAMGITASSPFWVRWATGDWVRVTDRGRERLLRTGVT